MQRLFSLSSQGAIAVASVFRVTALERAVEGYAGYLSAAGSSVYLFQHHSTRSLAGQVSLQLLLHPQYGVSGKATIYAHYPARPMGTVEELACMRLAERCDLMDKERSEAWLKEQGAAVDQIPRLLSMVLSWSLRHFSSPSSCEVVL